jgi:prepilin-type N-terminal cleavage/methylation domain-containing protein/prepilin-type processing-associated H-X9-DG protein
VRSAFTLIEVLIVCAVLVVLAAILLPAFASTREAARGASCLSRERQLGLAILSYSKDYDGALPLYASCPGHDRWWFQTLQSYTTGSALFGCPSVAVQPLPAGLGYGVNFLGVIRYGPECPWNAPGTAGPAYEAEFLRPAGTLVLADAGSSALYDPFFIGPGADPGFARRHHGGMNLLFLDGHARWGRAVPDYLWGRD